MSRRVLPALARIEAQLLSGGLARRSPPGLPSSPPSAGSTSSQTSPEPVAAAVCVVLRDALACHLNHGQLQPSQQNLPTLAGSSRGMSSSSSSSINRCHQAAAAACGLSPQAWLHHSLHTSSQHTQLPAQSSGAVSAAAGDDGAASASAATSEAEGRSPPTERVLRLVDEIAGLTLLEVSDLTVLLKRKLGLPDTPMMGGGPMMMMPMGGATPGGAAAGADAAAAAAPAVEEKTAFDVKLAKFDAAAKLKVIKEVRALTGLGLKESKELVESAPNAVIKAGVSKEEAESIRDKLVAAGAEVALE